MARSKVKRPQRRKGPAITEERLTALLQDAVEGLREQSVRKLPAGKFIWQYTDEELAAAIDRAAKQFGGEFYVLLNGIDAYMERRRRKYRARDNRLVRNIVNDPYGIQFQ